MYTVKQVVAMTGLAASTLRMWERRYGVVQPARTASHYRLFTDADVSRLRAMVQLIEAGMSPRAAAELVLTEAEMEASNLPEAPVSAPDDLLGPAAALDMGQMADLMARALTLENFTRACDEWLIPAIVALEQAQAAGALAEVHVKCAERVVKRRLGTLLDQTRASQMPEASQRTAVTPLVLVGQEEEGGRDVVPLAFCVAMRTHGVDARYLGGGIAHDDWLEACHQLRPRGVALAVSSPTGVADAQALATDLAALRPPIIVWLGGPGLASQTKGVRNVLPMSVHRATRTVLSQLRGGHAPNRGFNVPQE